MTVAVRSFAKINVGLYIGAARADGFHDLRTVYQTIALHDVIRVGVERGRGSRVEILCDNPRVPLDSSNTCYRIAELAMSALGATGRVTIEIEKRLPVLGGLGGASSNAVATMIALERVLERDMLTSGAKALKDKARSNAAREVLRHPKSQTEPLTKALSEVERLRIAAAVGSDLPLFLVGGTVLGVGRGEEVYPVADLPSLPVVVVMPEIGVSTARAFADWDALVESGAAFGSAIVPMRDARQLTLPARSDRLFLVGCALSAWLTGGKNSGYPNTGASAKGGSRAGKLLSDLVRTGIENDFERVVFPQYPELRDIKGALESAGAKYASLSGSGSTLYGLFRSSAEAAKAAGRLRRQGLKAVATRTLRRPEYWKGLFASGL